MVRTAEDAIEDVLQRRRPEARLHLEAHMRHARGRPASMHQNVAPVVKLRRDLLSSLHLNFSEVRFRAAFQTELNSLASRFMLGPVTTSILMAITWGDGESFVDVLIVVA